MLYLYILNAIFISRVPEGLEDVSKYPVIIAKLLERGWSEEEVKKVTNLNFMRVFRKVEKIAENMKKTIPSEEIIPDDDVQGIPCRIKY